MTSFDYAELLDAYSEDVKARLAKFTKFATLVGLTLEPFQNLIVSELFSGVRKLLILLPRGCGKTSLIAAISLYELLRKPDTRVYVAAAKQEQASILFTLARTMARSQPAIEDRLAFRRTELRRKDDDGVFKVLPADRAGSLHGLILDFAVVDELHAHPNDDTAVALETAMGKRPDAQMVTITTAGFDQESLLARTRKAALELPDKETYGTLTIARDPEASFAMLEWALPDDADLSDPAVVKMANPATFVSEKWLGEQYHSPSLPELAFARYHANIWTSAADLWLPKGAWENCLDPDATIPDGSAVYLGLDAGVKYDLSAIAIVHPRDDGKTVVRVKTFKPPGDGSTLDLALLEEEIRSLTQRYRVRAVVFDSHYFTRSAQTLEDEGIPMIEVPQSDTRMTKISMRLYEAITQGKIVHDGERTLTSHVLSGAVKQTPAGFRLVKSKAKRPIDGLIALALAYSEVTHRRSVYEDRGLLSI